MSKHILRIIIHILLFNFIIYYVESAPNTYRVFFQDKGVGVFEKGSDLYNKALETLSDRAIKRRLSNGFESVTFQDIPVNNYYLTEIEKLGAVILAKVRWENYCVIFLEDEVKLDQIKKMKFVKHVQATSSEFLSMNFGLENYSHDRNSKSIVEKLSVNLSDDESDSYFGMTEYYLKTLNISKIHQSGITGDSVLIGFLDTGFRPSKIKSMSNINVVAERDFIFRDDITYNQQFDHSSQDHHGTICLALALANQPGTYMGSSPNASVALAKTENLSYERKIEEDWYYEGTEWLESQGVDIISASLGYYRFDSTDISYNYTNLDGEFPVASKAVKNASERGILFMIAAGNNGPKPKSLNTPADSDYGLVVGAIDSLLNVTQFSSRGPDGLDRIKPHVLAPGNDVPVPSPTEFDAFSKGKGTSLATPLVSGGAALIKSAFPELKSNEIKNMIIKSSNNYENPDNEKGYGIPDFYNAMIDYDVVISEMMTYPTNKYQRVIFKINYSKPIDFAELYIHSETNGVITKLNLNNSFDNLYYADVPYSSFIKDTLLVSTKAFYDNNSRNRRKPYFEEQFMYLIKNSEKLSNDIDTNNLPSNIFTLKESGVSNTIAVVKDGNLNLKFKDEIFTNSQISIFNLVGSEILSKNLSIGHGNDVNIDIKNLTTGIYFVKVKKNNSNEILKILIY